MCGSTDYHLYRGVKCESQPAHTGEVQLSQRSNRLADLPSELTGVTLSPRRGWSLRCGILDWLLLLNEEIAGSGRLARLSRDPFVVVIVAVRNIETNV